MMFLICLTAWLLISSCQSSHSVISEDKQSHILTVIDTVRVCDTTRVDIRTKGDTIIIREYHRVNTDNVKMVGKTDTVVSVINTQSTVVKPENTFKKMLDRIFDIMVGVLIGAAFLLSEYILRRKNNYQK